MKLKITKDLQDVYSNWFYELRHKIIKMIEQIETDFNITENKINGSTNFKIKKWDRNGGGGGEISLLVGNVFEKMGVNVSKVYGELSEEMTKQLPGTNNARDFWASGISLVAHPMNPFIPPIHMNTRAISTSEKMWFGGGIDLNPIIENKEESDFFHSELKKVCDKHNNIYYERFSKWCDEYFWIKHRNESRGIGGIFFDYLDDDMNKNFEFIKDVGMLFISLYNQIVRNKINNKWTEKEREWQLIKRGRYAEFNLIYDRGIKFGLMTGGNPDGMMMSLPPLVRWN